MAKSIVVTVSDEALPDIRDVADRLAAQGMIVDRVMPKMGIISGSCAPAKTSALEAVQGVTSVEEEAVARLPPSGSHRT